MAVKTILQLFVVDVRNGPGVKSPDDFVCKSIKGHAFDPHQAYGALEYYHANREEIEDEISQDEVAAAHWEQHLAKDPNGR
jgi:hypothetical protein